MMGKTIVLYVVACMFLFTGFASAAINDPVDDNADVVHLQMDCMESNAEIDNCFTDTALLVNWLWNVRNPAVSETDPVLVKMAPGKYEFPTGIPFCINRGYVTLLGAGRDQTVINNDSQSILPDGAALRIENCNNVTVQNLTITSAATGVNWGGGGSSVWSDVDVSGGNYGWYDVLGTPGSESAVHYWYSSKVFVNDRSSFAATVAYQANKSENWFFGGEISAIGHSAHTGFSTFMYGVTIASGGSFQSFGSLIRVSTGASPNSFPQIYAVKTNGIFHSHGGNIAADASGSAASSGITTIGIGVSSTGVVHTPGTGFRLNGSVKPAKIHRIILSAGGVVQSPFVWPAGTDIPKAPRKIWSVTGMDMFIETDCNSTGDCNGVGEVHPHSMIYDEACSVGGPWFDTVTGQCRQ